MSVTRELLLLHLPREAAEVEDRTIEQYQHYERREFEKAIQVGDHWRGVYRHIPCIALFDIVSALAEFELGRARRAVLRILRADAHVRSWERALTAEGIALQEEELIVMQLLYCEMHDHLLQITEWLADSLDHEGCAEFIEFVRQEYNRRMESEYTGVAG